MDAAWPITKTPAVAMVMVMVMREVGKWKKMFRIGSMPTRFTASTTNYGADAVKGRTNEKSHFNSL